MKIDRVQLAAFTAPLTPSLVIFFIQLVNGTPLKECAINSLFFAPFSYIGFVLVGCSSFAVLKKYNKVSYLSLALCGMIGSALIYTAIMYVLTLEYRRETSDIFFALFTGAGFGGLVAFSFCAVAGIKKYF